jgi:hypothetical protein
MRRLDSFSDNPKSKIQNRKLAGIVALVVTLALCGDDSANVLARADRVIK